MFHVPFLHALKSRFQFAGIGRHRRRARRRLGCVEPLEVKALLSGFGLLETINNPGPTPIADDLFGFSVAISEEHVLVGAPFDDTGATDAGSAYLFDLESGSFLQTFNNPTPEAGDQFGFSVAISEEHVLVGAHRDDTGATDAGSAYLFGAGDDDEDDDDDDEADDDDDWEGLFAGDIGDILDYDDHYDDDDDD